MFLTDSDQPRSACAAAVPFAGLGYNLQPVKALAARMSLTRINVQTRHASEQPRPAPVAAPAGFALLLLLGREIRGR